MSNRRLIIKLNKWFLSAITFFIGGIEESPKKKIMRYALYTFIVLAANVLLGKNISNNRYPWYANVSSILLMNINIILVLVLFILLFRHIAKLMIDRREKVFGARLQTKLVIFTVFLVVLPVFSMYFISTRMVQQSIDRWFDTNVNNTILSALSVSQGYYDDSLRTLAQQTEILAKNINEYDDINMSEHGNVRLLTKDYIDRYIFNGVILYSKDGRLYSQQNIDTDYGFFINKIVLSSVMSGITMSDFINEDDVSFFWCGVPIKHNGEVVGALFSVKQASASIQKNTDTINHMYDLMRQLKFYSHPVRAAFNVSSFLVALIVIFSSIWGSIIFVRSITVPLEDLSAAAGDISKGKLDIQLDVSGNDEITLLSRSFNTMASALRERTQELHRKNKDLGVALSQISKDKKNIDIIYSNVDSGIVLFDKDLNILKSNEYADVFKAFINSSALNLKEFSEGPEIEKMLQLNVEHNGEAKVFSVHINKIFDSSGELENIILVVDDNTHIINLQRITLWKEVATRITHEIKNPLTPIKLTAERVKRRSHEIASPVMKELVDKSMQTIINESEELLVLVDEFNQYARLPSFIKSNINLKELVSDVVNLQGYTGKNIRVDIDIPDDIVIVGDKYQLKRALLNLIQNASHAIDSEGVIKITAVKDHKDSLSFIVEDNGCGIKEDDIANIFVPYFSKKPDGTGLGLAIVKKIIEEHGGSITVESKSGEFTRFHIHLPY